MTTIEIALIVAFAAAASFCLGYCIGCDNQRANDEKLMCDADDHVDVFLQDVTKFYAEQYEIRDKEIETLKKQLSEKG